MYAGAYACVFAHTCMHKHIYVDVLLVYYCSCTKLPKIECVKTSQIYSLTTLEV